jgi:hypothetical protein
MADTDEIGARDVAEYVRDLALELAHMARRAGLVSVAGGLEQAHRAADAEVRALQSPNGNAAPDDAA